MIKKWLRKKQAESKLSLACVIVGRWITPAIIGVLFLAVSLYLKSVSQQTLVISFVGDILLDRGVLTHMEQNGFDDPFSLLNGVFDKTDIVCGNLEGPLTEGGIPSFKDPKYIFKAPPEIAQSLKQAGFNLLNLSNNHTMDHGAKGLLDTMKALDQYGISYFGGGDNRRTAAEPVFIDLKGTRVGFLAYSAFPPEGYFYTEEKPNISMLDRSSLSESVRKARDQCDFLVVSFHWGREFDFFPDTDQKNTAYTAVKHGADVVIGHHPHVFQCVEEYQGKLIFYSLGNFIFDQQIPPGTDETVIVNLSVQKSKLVQYELLPVRILDCRPVVLKGEEGKNLLKKMLQYSDITLIE